MIGCDCSLARELWKGTYTPRGTVQKRRVGPVLDFQNTKAVPLLGSSSRYGSGSILRTVVILRRSGVRQKHHSYAFDSIPLLWDCSIR